MIPANDLYLQAIKYGLEIPQSLHDASPAEREACWNGAGPERLPKVRRFLTFILAFLEPIFLIHDWRYYKAIGTRQDWLDANAQMERNGHTLIRRKLAWWLIWRRPGLEAANEGARIAVDSQEGCKAYQDAYAARVEREFTPGPEMQA